MTGLILLLVILILSIILHEVAHGYAANALGDPTARLAGRLTLNPVPHIDLMGSVIIPGLLLFTSSPFLFGWAKPVPYNPHNLQNKRWGETLVAIAGSATNILIAIIFGLLIRYGGGLLSEPALALAEMIAYMNLFLGVFNLIPFPPLDGFTVLRSALPWSLSHSLMRFESSLQGQSVVTLILFLLVFSYFLAEPFYHFVVFLFTLIAG